MQIKGISERRIPTRSSGRTLIGGAIFCMFLLGGCAITTPANQQANSLELLIKDAEVELANGRRDKALALLNQAAKEHPTNMAPWLKIANIWFDAGNYPSSILAANEVLQRDATNQDAKSMLVVAGLRVAASAVTGLRPNGAVNTSARMEAESLTNSLRGVLGEKILVPAPAVEAKPANYVPRSKTRSNAATTSGSSAAAPQVNPAASSADPFRSLK